MSATKSVSALKPVLAPKFQNYRQGFDSPENTLEDKFDIAEQFGSYLEGVRDTLTALNAAPEELKLVEMTERVNKADIEKVQSEFDLTQALS